MSIESDNKGILFNLELTKYALDVMDEATDANEAIDKVLKRIGQFYGIRHITVLEKKSKLNCFIISNEWCDDGIASIKNHIITYSSDFRKYFFDEAKDNDIITKDIIEKFDKKQSIKKIMADNHSQDVIVFGLKNKDNYYAVISFELDQPADELSKEEMACFMQTKKIFEQFFWKMQQYEDATRKLEQVTLYDPITGLIKYEVFLEQAEVIYRDDKSNMKYAIMYADIANFKYFNEMYGYAAGDDTLRMFEQHFMSDNRFHIIGCRIFSDYFVALVTMDPDSTAHKICQTITSFDRTFSKKIQKIFPEANIKITVGIACIKDRTVGIQTYIDNANLARKMAKRTNETCIIYNYDMEKEKKRKIEIDNRAETALKEKEFYFLLQPKADLITKKVVGAEALVRWKDKKGNIYYPNEFIPIFEHSGFIVKLDFYVYTQVCEFIRNRLDKGLPVVPISVNVSRVHLTRGNFVKKIMHVVEQYNIPTKYLEFELTESVFLENAVEAQATMQELKHCGFKVSMDDFGSGYSSLNLLTSLDFDILKLDKEFLTEDGISKKDEVVIDSIIRMAKLMNMVVLCEGVETKEQVDFLKRLNCDLVQGYYFGKPMDVENFNQMLEDN